MTRIAWLCYAFCALVTAGFIAATTPEMPAQVASHFGARHAANAWMSRGGYLVFMLAFGVGLPALVAGAISLLPRVRPDAINIPNRAYWLAPPRRQETIDALSAHGAWFGCLMSLFLAGIHYVVLEANRATPPRLPIELFVSLIVIFAAVLAFWIVWLWLRFRNPG